jgi:hypothetical protein
MTWLLWLVLLSFLLVAAVVGISTYGSIGWIDQTRALTARLEATRVDGVKGRLAPPARFDSRELDGLPGPVQRFFRAVLTEGQPIVSAVTIDLAGTFNLSATAERWVHFTSRQRVTACRPGFLWDARMSMLPGVGVRVVDSYIAGEGLLHAAVLGLFTMANVRGGGEIARGEFMRFFAEAAWYPTVLLPSQGTRWQVVDDRSANATMVDGALTLALLFRFNDAGQIDSFRAEARGAGVGKDMVMFPWEGNWSDYRTHDGMTLPFSGEVAWMRPEGRRPYFRGTVTSLGYEFAS